MDQLTNEEKESLIALIGQMKKHDMTEVLSRTYKNEVDIELAINNLKSVYVKLNK